MYFLVPWNLNILQPIVGWQWGEYSHQNFYFGRVCVVYDMCVFLNAVYI